jgi:hypothetical protein
MKRISTLVLASVALLATSPLHAQSTNDAAQSWSETASRFSKKLGAKLTEANHRLAALNEKIAAGQEHAEEQVRARLDELRKEIEQGRAKFEAAQAELKNWAEAKENAAAMQVAEWKAKHETRVLEDRAGRAEYRAAASIEVAMAAIEDAERATLEAWLARQDANTARAKQAEGGH